jgi:TonB family protein
MKAVSKLAVLLSLAALAPFASAKSEEQAYIESCTKAPGVPVPIAVVTPSVRPGYEGSVVQLEFVVDATGKPAQFSVKATPDDELARTVMDAVKQWRFKAAIADGKPVATVRKSLRGVSALRGRPCFFFVHCSTRNFAAPQTDLSVA